jgi:hypothetical protein
MGVVEATPSGVSQSRCFVSIEAIVSVVEETLQVPVPVALTVLPRVEALKTIATAVLPDSVVMSIARFFG